MSHTQINLIDYLKKFPLPITIVETGQGINPKLLIETPFGQKEIDLNTKHYPFLFGSVTQTDKSLSQIEQEITELVERSKNYLLESWRIGQAKQ